MLRQVADSSVVAHEASDADGRFRLGDLAPGRYLLRIAALGHLAHARADVTITSDATVDLGTITLAVSPLAVPGVEVSTSRSTAVLAADRNV